MARVFRVAQAHENHDLAARVTGPGRPPLATVDQPLITVTHGAGSHIGGIRRSNVRFGHGKRRANLTAQQRLQPPLFLRRAGVAHQDFHVAGIRCRTVERLGAQHRAPHDFCQRRVFKVAQPGPQFGLGQKQIPQAFSPGLELQLFHDRRRLPAVAFSHLLIKNRLRRVHMGVHKRCHTLAQCLNFRGISEIHKWLPSTGNAEK